jgi:hypothetical protein
LNVPGPAFFGRKGLKHRIKNIAPGAFDDELAFNTQSSSQWDGFRHFAHPTYNCHYNGVISDEIMADLDGDGEDGEEAPERSRKLGIDAWAKKGIIGRGILLDVYSWVQKSGKAYDPFTKHSITADDLRECAESQGTSFQTGDILLIRTGWLSTYNALSIAQKSERSTMPLDQHFYAGLDATDPMKDFLYDNYFAAAATDNMQVCLACGACRSESFGISKRWRRCAGRRGGGSFWLSVNRLTYLGVLGACRMRLRYSEVKVRCMDTQIGCC